MTSPPLHRLRLLCASLCNLRCDYCHVYDDRRGAAAGAPMSAATARAILDLYRPALDADPAARVEVGFYGGEPLTNWATVTSAFDKMKRGQAQFPTVMPQHPSASPRTQPRETPAAGHPVPLCPPGPLRAADRCTDVS